MIDLSLTGIANGGEAVGRDESNRAVFVAGGLPGERVRVEVVDEHDRWARARLVEVSEPAPGRVAPPCPMVAQGCGGCDFQHAEPALQRTLKEQMVVDALERVGRLTDIPLRAATPLAATAYRTTLRCIVDGGRAGFRRRRSHEPVLTDECLVAHPLIASLLSDADFGDASEVVLRVSVATDERMVVASPSAAGVVVPTGVVVVGTDELKAGRRAWITEEIAGHRLRISGDSFFQASAVGAEQLVAEVRRAVDGAPEGLFVDLFGGVGLFAATAAGSHPVQLVERSRSAVADAKANLAGVDARIVRCRVEDWRASAAAVVVADPARSGLGKPGVARVAATGAARVVLVSCDAASLGRDAALLTGRGYRLVETTVVDLFPQTSQVEVVSRFDLD